MSRRTLVFWVTLALIGGAVALLVLPEGELISPSWSGSVSVDHERGASLSAPVLERRVAPPIESQGGALRVVVKAAEGAVRGAQILRPGPQGLMASSISDSLGGTGDDGVCVLRLGEVSDTGFGVVAASYQARFVPPERLGDFGAGQDAEMVVTLQPAVSLTVSCEDVQRRPLSGCRVIVSRYGALEWVAKRPDEVVHSLDAVNGQHVFWSGENGIANVTGLAPTTYYVRVERSGFCAVNAGSSQSFIDPPGSISVVMAPIEVVRASIVDDGRGYLHKLSTPRNSPERVFSVGVLDAARRQLPSLFDEEFWAIMDMAGGRSPASERLTVLFGNGSRKSVDIPYQPLDESSAIVVEPGLPEVTYEVSIEVASISVSGLSVDVRVARLGDLGSTSGRSDCDVAADLKAPCQLLLPSGIYLVTVTGASGMWFQPQRFEVTDEAVDVRIACSEPIVPVLFKRDLPSGYLPGLWYIQILSSGYPSWRRQCTQFDTEVSVLVPVGALSYVVRAPGLGDISGSAVVTADGVRDIMLRQEWE